MAVVVGVGVGASMTFKSGLYKPRIINPLLKVVIFRTELYLTCQPANVALRIEGRSTKWR